MKWTWEQHERFMFFIYMENLISLNVEQWIYRKGVAQIYQAPFYLAGYDPDLIKEMEDANAFYPLDMLRVEGLEDVRKDWGVDWFGARELFEI